MKADRPLAALASGVATLRARISRADCARWSAGTHGARSEWTADFDAEQFSLGRAFYTHLEQDRSHAYFADAAASDARVEAHVPGLQGAMRAMAAAFVEGNVRPRRGWCGPGVHIFPAGGHVAKNGGVVHFDTEGLTAHHIETRGRAITLVAMLAPAESGGGLRVWDVAYDGHDEADAEELKTESVVVDYAVGDVVVLDSYRLHQIQPFGGVGDRISATIHLAEIDLGHWESWF